MLPFQYGECLYNYKLEHSAIVNWSECVGSYIDVEDRVDLYYVTVENLDQFTKAPVIDSVSFAYDVETEGLVEE